MFYNRFKNGAAPILTQPLILGVHSLLTSSMRTPKDAGLILRAHSDMTQGRCSDASALFFPLSGSSRVHLNGKNRYVFCRAKNIPPKIWRQNPALAIFVPMFVGRFLLHKKLAQRLRNYSQLIYTLHAYETKNTTRSLRFCGNTIVRTGLRRNPGFGILRRRWR